MKLCDRLRRRLGLPAQSHWAHLPELIGDSEQPEEHDAVQLEALESADDEYQRFLGRRYGQRP